ncbi:MAG: hypothetical protein PHH22_00230 [Clostridia bacterium]|nr:hypothetical protein [Clostridia bacterium]
MKDLDYLNSKLRHLLCVDDSNAKVGVDDKGEINLMAGMVYHLQALKVYDNYTLVQLNEFPELWFNSMRFTEVEYSKDFSDFHIFDSRMRHVVCINNEDIYWSFNDNASKYLKVGWIYHVSEVEVHDWHTRIRLLEFSGLQFQSTHFSEIIFRREAIC